MRAILAHSHLTRLRQFAQSDVIVAFDFDGTLAPIVADPSAAKMRARTAALFRRVCELYPCAVISGRSRSDLRLRMAGAKVKWLIGNHGMEPGRRLAVYARQVRVLRAYFESAIGDIQGLEIEDKRYSLALHYRSSREKRRARARMLTVVERSPIRLRVVPGKLVVNVIPEGAPHKGEALVALRTTAGADTAIYVGDDVTDEDVFRLDDPGRLLSIRVGRSRNSAAPYFLRSQVEVDGMLAALVDFRSDAPGQRTAARRAEEARA
jgi:trehalose 6-phosphate phosphatase